MYAQLRAIEQEDILLDQQIREFSSIINHLGEIEKSIGWDSRESIKAHIPLYGKKTFYVKHGDFLGRLSAFFSIIVLLYFIVIIN